MADQRAVDTPLSGLSLEQFMEGPPRAPASCPYCGSDQIGLARRWKWWGRYRWGCRKCGATRGMWLPTARTALLWWDQRAQLDSMRAQLTAHWTAHRATLETDVIELIIGRLASHGRIDCSIAELRAVDLGGTPL